VRRRDKEVIEIGECASLAFVIDRLQAFSRSLPPHAQPEVAVGGNEYFGWRLTISFFRELTSEEAALEARYSRHLPVSQQSCQAPAELNVRGSEPSARPGVS
jgi:hypothetical protein